MKKGIKKTMMIIALCVMVLKTRAQSYEVQCLLLDVSKLAQLKSILSDMKKGYETLTGGYNAVKDISEGNFHLHEMFLDNLMKVSPVVRNYRKVADLISDQLSLMREYKSASQRFKGSKNFAPAELGYIGTVYTRLVEESLKNVDDLTVIISSGVLRMSDDERLNRIDELAEDMHDKLIFLRQFTNKTSILSLQRQHQQHDVNSSEYLFGTK